MAIGGHVLDDHVDVDARIGQGRNTRAAMPGSIRDAGNRDLGLGGVVRDPRDDRLLHPFTLRYDPRSLPLAEG